ncbi:MAG: DnaD domain protein [Alkalibacterium sp.]|nr:DnaD domain protein [Alkalibacterium sp.]
MNYPWQTISPKDTVTLMKFTILSDVHVKSLVSLYHPLIGHEAMSLYLVMKEYLDQSVKVEMMLSDILIQLNCGVKDYYQARIKLEAYGLLRVFKHTSDESSYALALEAPMNPHQFFADSMMKMMLIEKVGERMVKDLEERFKVQSQNLKEYSEVTKSFLDVIHIDMKKMSETIDNDEGEKHSSESITEQAMKSEQFDWSFFIEGLNKHYINSSSLTLSIKKLIYTFHVIYDINELEMQKFVLEAADISSGKVDENKLTALIQKRYLKQKKTKESVKVSDSSENNDYHVNQLKQKGFSREEIEIILHAEQMNPYGYLKSIKQQKGGFVTSNETWLLKELVENAPLSTAVINILLNYLLIIKDAPTLEKGLATKIANDWAQSHVKTPEEAMQKVKQLYASFKEKQQPQPRQSYSKSKSKATHARKETLPDWATQTAEKDERLSTEEEAAFKEKLKRIRNKKSGDS